QGGKTELQDMISDLTAMSLDPTKSLWKLHLIENYNGGCVLFWRIHHCIADGISLIHVLLSTADKTKDAPWPEMRVLKKVDTPKKGKKPGKYFRDISNQLNFKKLKKTAADIADMGNILSRQMISEPKTVLKGTLGVRKCAAWSEPFSLTDAKSVGRAFGGTLNDVFVSAVTGALRRYLLEKNTIMDDLDIRVSMPVNVRPSGTELELGNQFGLVSLGLPVYIEDPIARFREVKKRNDKIKGSPEASVNFHALKTMGMAPANIAKKTADFFADKGTAVMSNVPGPARSIYFAGQEIKNIMFWVPCTGHIGMGISIISYAGKVTLGIASDENLVSDPQIILEYFNEEMQNLLQLAQSEESVNKQIDAYQTTKTENCLSHIMNEPSDTVKAEGFGRLKKMLTLGVKSVPFHKLLKKYTDEDSRFIEINGTRVHYCDQGEGPVVVLLHGILSSLQTWNDWVESLSGHYRIIRLDMPGFGLTEHFESEPYSKELNIDFLNRFFESLGLEKFDIAGNSIGGYFAWNYALAYPEKVNKLVLLDPVGYPQDLPGIINFVNIPGLSNLAARVTPRIFIEKSIREIYGNKAKVTDELIDQYHDMLMNPQNRGVYVDIFRLLKQKASSTMLCHGINEIKAPTLLMWGKDDPWVPVGVVKEWERDLPLSKTIVYDGVGHLPMEEIPRQSASDTHAFLMS
ncbi:alpha/beta fold hydrolase, partial [Desulfobacterales bacterium HSG16]|nr:alpha/beta fold hydrolase [Desulfobacterales bacterium HSG16]